MFQNVSLAQLLDPTGRDGFTPDHIIKSEITNKEYLIHMSFPKNYSIKDSIRYPVLYVLDGKSTFGYFESPAYIDFEKIEDVIMVGISHKVTGNANSESHINILRKAALNIKLPFLLSKFLRKQAPSNFENKKAETHVSAFHLY
ncbi:MAG: hypothetical protein HRU26_17360 [Psychroserpens sp.]|nr:hypothetical protein [Psychroserpens sp.]